MAVLIFRARTFAFSIYIGGTERFTARDGYNGVPVDYIDPVKNFAAKGDDTLPGGITYDEIENAFTNGWITKQEYDETIAIKGPKPVI
jgi:hypothetical protein